jgi:antitoxin HicB
MPCVFNSESRKPTCEEKMHRFEYAVRLTIAAEGGFVVTCRDLPQLVTQGEDKDDALEQAADALEEVIAAYMLAGMALPAPGPGRKGEYWVSLPAGTSAKAALYVAMHEADISNVELAARMGIDEKEVRRLLDPHYGSKLPRIAKAIAALGRRLVIGLEVA